MHRSILSRIDYVWQIYHMRLTDWPNLIRPGLTVVSQSIQFFLLCSLINMVAHLWHMKLCPLSMWISLKTLFIEQGFAHLWRMKLCQPSMGISSKYLWNIKLHLHVNVIKIQKHTYMVVCSVLLLQQICTNEHKLKTILNCNNFIACEFHQQMQSTVISVS